MNPVSEEEEGEELSWSVEGGLDSSDDEDEDGGAAEVEGANESASCLLL